MLTVQYEAETERDLVIMQYLGLAGLKSLLPVKDV
jgi:hypothetical protein